MGNPPNVAVVIVTWNKRDDVLRLLESLTSLDYTSYDIFLVDNASSDGTVYSVQERFPHVCILENAENLGGTGGFNRGLNFVLQEGTYEYVWMLDNDALPESSTLTELVNVAERDSRIAIVGSRIMNPNKRDMIVEVGACIDWRKGDVRPLFRNQPLMEATKECYDVDYVAVCSALVRLDALRRVGLMDPRHFVFWDDMDWGITFRRHGYRVVCSNRSVVYHPAFTEKRGGNLSLLYYGCRNRLLTISKHGKGVDRIRSLYFVLRRIGKMIVHYTLSGHREIVKAYVAALCDFIRSKWGRCDYSWRQRKRQGGSVCLPSGKRFVIFPAGDRLSVENLVLRIRREVKDSHIAFLLPVDREPLFAELMVDETIRFEGRTRFPMLHMGRLFFAVWIRDFDIGIFPDLHNAVLISAAVRDVYIQEDGLFYAVRRGRLGRVSILFASIILGEMLSILIFPLLWLISLRYGVTVEETP